MSGVLLAAWRLLAIHPACFGQTHSSAAAGSAPISNQSQVHQGHVFPPPELKLLDLPFRTPAPIVPSPVKTSAFSSRMSLQDDPAQLAVFRKIEREGLVKPQSLPECSDLER